MDEIGVCQCFDLYFIDFLLNGRAIVSIFYCLQRLYIEIMLT